MDNLPVELVDTALLSLLRDNTVNLSRVTDNNLNKDNMAHRLELRDITVLNLDNPVSLVKAKVNTDLNLSLDRHTERLLEYLLDLDNLLKELTDNNPRASTVNNLDRVRGSMANNPDKDSTGSNPDKANTDSSPVKDRDNTANNLLKANMVNNQVKVKVNTVNNLLKVNTVNSPQHPVEAV
jgi:hypothetical protein